MGRLDITGRLSLNAAPFHAALNAAGKAVDSVGNKMAKNVGGALLGIFGGKSLVGFGKEMLDTAHTITQLSNRFSLTSTEVQLLQKEAERTGVSFESLTKDADELEETLSRLNGGEVIFTPSQIRQLEDAHQILNGLKDSMQQEGAKLIMNPGLLGKRLVKFFFPIGGSTIDASGEGAGDNPAQDAFQEKQAAAARARERDFQNRLEGAKAHMATQDRIVEMEKEAAEINEKTRVSRLTTEQRINELIEKRAKLNRIFAVEEGEENAAARGLAIAKVEQELQQLQAKGAVQRLSPMSDSLSSVGNFLGSNTNTPGVRELSEANRTLKEIERNTKGQANNGGFRP